METMSRALILLLCLAIAVCVHGAAHQRLIECSERLKSHTVHTTYSGLRTAQLAVGKGSCLGSNGTDIVENESDSIIIALYDVDLEDEGVLSSVGNGGEIKIATVIEKSHSLYWVGTFDGAIIQLGRAPVRWIRVSSVRRTAPQESRTP